MTQASQSEGNDFRIKDALTTFQEFAEKELQQRRDSEEPLDEALFDEAVALVTHYLKADLESGELDEPATDPAVGFADGPQELELLEEESEPLTEEESEATTDQEPPATSDTKEQNPQ